MKLFITHEERERILKTAESAKVELMRYHDNYMVDHSGETNPLVLGLEKELKWCASFLESLQYSHEFSLPKSTEESIFETGKIYGKLEERCHDLLGDKRIINTRAEYEAAMQDIAKFIKENQ